MKADTSKSRLFRASSGVSLGLTLITALLQPALGETVLVGIDRTGQFVTEERTTSIPAAVALDDETSPQGIRGSGVRGIRGSGVRGIRGSGVRNDDEAEALGIRGSGVRGIRGSGVRNDDEAEALGIRGSGVRSSKTVSTQGIRGSGLRDSSDGARNTSSSGVPLLAMGPVGQITSESISILGTEVSLSPDVVVLRVDSAGQAMGSASEIAASEVTLGRYVAVGGSGLGETAVASVVVISPAEYIDGASRVYLRGSIVSPRPESASLTLSGISVDYSASLWNDEAVSLLEDGAIAEISGFAFSGMVYADAIGVLFNSTPNANAVSQAQGIRGSGVRGIRGSGVRGIRGSGVRNDDEAEALGIRGSGVRGIRGSGVRGIRGSGVRNDDEAEALGIRGSGVRGIRGSGVRNDDEAETLGIRGSGVR